MPDARVVLPARQWPGGLLNMNQQRGHTKYGHGLIRTWRDYGRHMGTRMLRRGLIEPMQPGVRLWFEVRHETNHVRDTPNVLPTAKALVDGLVDAGVLPADRDGVLEGPLVRRVYPNGAREIILRFEDIGVDALGR